jgi:hypothetical protein
LEPNLAGMFLGWSSTKLLFFVPVGYSIWLPGPIICSDWLKFQRSSAHIIGPINNGKGQLICRFRNRKVKNSIFMKKKNLKNNKDNIFITEDLTKFRQSIIKELNAQKKAKKLNSFWTFDGRIFAKKTDDSRKTFIRCIQDINDLIQ